MEHITRYIRYYILATTVCLAVTLPLIWQATSADPTVAIIRLAQSYALLAFTTLYFTLLPSPLYSAFPSLPFRTLYTKARRALGVSTFIFGGLHGSLAFFGLLGGVNGLAFLSFRYISAILLGTLALTILTLMAATSFDYMVKKMGPRWKQLHRLVYLASWAILVHAVMLGSHFAPLSNPVAQIFFVALIFLFIIESIRIDKSVAQRWPNLPPNVMFTTLTLGLVLFFVALSLFPQYFLFLNLHIGH